MTTSPVQLHSILVPLDGSPLAEQAIPMAVSIAERAHSKLKLVLVHEPAILLEPGPNYSRVELATRRADRDYLNSVTARLRERLGSLVSSAVLRRMPVAHSLSTYIRELGADLVVMSTHGRGGLRRAWLGSVSDQLIRSSDIPVLVVRPAETGVPPSPVAITEILVPLDGSPLAEAALEPAARLARLWDAEVSLVQVVPPVILASGPHFSLPGTYSNKATALRRDAAQDYLRDIMEHLRESGVRSTGVAVIGERVPDTLIHLAQPDRVSLVVVSTHGFGGLKRMVLGSVADKLLRAAEVPVLVLKPRGRRVGRKSEMARRDPAGASA